MKHWDGLEQNSSEPVCLPGRDARSLAKALRPVARSPRRPPASGASMVGLVLSVTMLAGLLWALWPDSPVAPELLR